MMLCNAPSTDRREAFFLNLTYNPATQVVALYYSGLYCTEIDGVPVARMDAFVEPRYVQRCEHLSICKYCAL